MSRLVPYWGGKRNLTKTILNLLPAHQRYCEPFGGSATILLEKSPSPAEVYNDLNGDLVNLFRVLKYHPREFLDTVRWHLRSREDFDRFKALPSRLLTDVHRAARLYYLLRANFHAMPPDVRCHFVGKQQGSQRPASIYRIEESLYEIHRRLENVTIEHLPYNDCIRRYDDPQTLFYCDPPYFNHEKDYGPGVFARDDFTKLSALLTALRGSFLLSLNDLPEVRQLFSAFHFKEVSTTYSHQKGGTKKVTELLIANYPLPQN